MNRIQYIIAVVMLLVLAGCDDSFLEAENRYGLNTDTYYKTPDDMDAAVSGIYNALYVNGVHSDEHLAANLLSDLMLGGGGPDDKSAKNVDSFQDPNEDTYKDLWVETYKGIFRANNIIEGMEVADFAPYFDTDQEALDYKNKTLGEVYFMRGFLLFRAAKFFGGMPLIMSSTTPRDLPRATIPETYGQIASDLQRAIDLMPTVSATAIPVEEYGHANRWVAQAYLARVYLFFTGYMTNIEKTATTEITLPEGAGTITQADVIAALNDCIANSGYALESDFRNLWPYSYVNERAGEVVLPWADTEGLAWAGQDGPNGTFGTGNSEVMFSLRYAYGNWDWDKGQSYNNRICLFFGIRDNSMVPFGQGWGWGTIHPLLLSQWDNTDQRKLGSILQLGEADQGTDGYQADKGDHETGMFNKKYTTLQHDGAEGVKGLFFYLYNMVHGDPLQLWAAQDFFYMRFADVLLMQSELTGDNTSMNLVRVRAGLPTIAYSLDAIKEERMHEFAFEGLRWFDLVRWGDVENDANNFYSDQVDVRNSGVAGKYSVTYRPETKGLVPVPESEIRLSNGIYQQNPGW
ncbi:glycan metabolism protein RagB [Reichenbachiella sp. 5M10]|nr:glycan metabolism protein RagB [Reichenbachiella sp. 5M10]